MSMSSGEPLVWCDTGKLTTERTAGTTALAVVDLTRNCSAPGARLSHLPFKSDRAFPVQC